MYDVVVELLMFYCCAEMTELVIRSVNQTNPNRRQFRDIARDSCGETFEPPSSDMLFFGTVNENVVAVGSCQMAAAERTEATASTDSDSDYANVINYVFVRPRFQGHGYGGKLVRYMEDRMMSVSYTHLTLPTKRIV